MSLLRVALGEDCHPAGDYAARAGDELLHSAEGFAGGNNVINDEHALALDELGVGSIDDELLYAHRGDGLDVHLEHAGHIGLGAFAGEEVLIRAALAGHFIQQRDRLGFRCDQIIVLGSALEQLGGAVNGKLHIAEHDECADVQVVRHLAQGQLAFQAGNVHLVSHFFDSS